MIGYCLFSFRLVSCWNSTFEMTTEEQSQSSDIQQSNGTEDDDTQEHENQSTSNTSSVPVGRRTRFFRTKRKQRRNEEYANQVDDHTDEPSEPVTPSENLGKTIKWNILNKSVFIFLEQPAEETSVEEISTINADTKIEPTLTRRPLSPPPPPPSSDDIDELDGSSTSEPTEFSLSTVDPDTESQAYLTHRDTLDNTSFAQSKSSLPTIYAGYKRKKSQSVKLTRINPLDAYPKKNVRFADDFGLDLSQIKVIKSDELPHVPSAAFKDLHISDDNPANIYQERMKTITYLEQKFENPIHSHGFEDRVSRHKVVLEQASKSIKHSI